MNSPIIKESEKKAIMFLAGALIAGISLLLYEVRHFILMVQKHGC